jgi:hypothetical protein
MHPQLINMDLQVVMVIRVYNICTYIYTPQNFYMGSYNKYLHYHHVSISDFFFLHNNNNNISINFFGHVNVND